MLVKHNLQYAALVLQHKYRITYEKALSLLHEEVAKLEQEYRDNVKGGLVGTE